MPNGRRKDTRNGKSNGGANLGFEATLWTAADKLRSECYVRDERARYKLAEDRDEYLAENIFWVPKEARWSYLQANAKQPTIGKLPANYLTRPWSPSSATIPNFRQRGRASARSRKRRHRDAPSIHLVGSSVVARTPLICRVSLPPPRKFARFPA